MVPLIALLLTYGLARFALRRQPDRRLAGRLALAVMLVVTGVAHFTSTEALAAMIPPRFPAPMMLVYATGIAELLFALMLLIPKTATPLLGWALVVFLAAIFPANVYSAVNEVGMGGHGAGYLWFRIPLQILFIAWAAYCTAAVAPTASTGEEAP